MTLIKAEGLADVRGRNGLSGHPGRSTVRRRDFCRGSGELMAENEARQRLGAIFAADVAVYPGLMGKDKVAVDA